MQRLHISQINRKMVVSLLPISLSASQRGKLKSTSFNTRISLSDSDRPNVHGEPRVETEVSVVKNDRDYVIKDSSKQITVREFALTEFFLN